jgi:rhodanese-related sulfurtransferase
MKTTFKLTLLLFFTVLNIACNHGQSSKSTEKLGDVSVLAPAVFQEKSMNQTIIDVRTPAEFSSGYIEGAINIDFFSDDFLAQIGKLNKNETLFIYCRSGNRSSKAAQKIRDLGFKEIVDLQGGINNWNKSKQKLVK